MIDLAYFIITILFLQIGSKTIQELNPDFLTVITSNSKPVGKVVDIIGPESDPFVVLKLDPRINLKELKGMKFYQGTHNNRRKSNGRKRSRVHRNMSRV